MSARLFSGRDVAQAMDEQTSARVQALLDAGVVPTLATVRVGERPDDVAYEHGATKRARRAGMQVRNIVLSENVPQEALTATMHALSVDDGVHGVLVLRPLPGEFDEELICAQLDTAKDIDGCTVGSHAGVYANESHGFAPCTPRSCVEMLDYYGVPLEGKHAVVVGRSLVFGRPVAMKLLARNATVTLAHSRTEDLAAITRSADIVIVGIGHANFLGPQYFREGQNVIDVGINFLPDGSCVGDVDTAAVAEVVAGISPVPGGIGAVTTSVLCRQTVCAAERQSGRV